MKKTILTKDIELNILTKKAGKTGIILMKQDEVGGHVVTLDVGNVGEIFVDPTPDVTTQLTYVIDDEKVFWTSTVLDPAIPYTAPAAITDLTIEYINTTDVKIKWTAPVADENRPLQKASAYTLICSEVMLTDNLTSLTMMQMQKQKLRIEPKLGGEEEVYTITNLLAGKRYYLNVISENSIRGKLLLSTPSNIQVFYTPFDNKAVTEVSSIIPLRDTHGRVYTYFTMPFSENPTDNLNENNYQITGRRLADQTGFANVDGEPDGQPVDGEYGYITPWAENTGDSPPEYVPNFYGFISGSWGNPYSASPKWYNFDNPWIMFDLDGPWDITSIWCYVNTEMIVAEGFNINQDSRRFEFKASPDGTNYTVIGSIDANYGVQGWFKVDVATSIAKDMKYFVVGATSYHLGAIAVYGVRSASYTISGHKLKRETPSRTIKERIGVNAFLGEQNIDKMASLSDVTRWYNNANWFINSPTWNKRLEDVSDIEVEDVEYKFVDTLDDWNAVEQFTTFKDAGVTNLLCINNTIGYNTTTTDIASLGEAVEAVPLDPYVTRDLSSSTIPANYKHFARLWYNLVAKLGANPDADSTYVNIKSSEDQTLGLNLVNYGECNNERDAIWSESRFMNSEQNAAMQSAVYDGHKNTMGGGYGVKNADPSFKFLNSATVAPETGYFFRMMKWWDYHRGQGNYPLDVISYHHYLAFSDLPDTYASMNSWAVRPERKPQFDFKRGKLWEFPTFRDMFMPSKELWLTETGYSEHYGGSCAPNYPTQIERSWYKACWTLRLLIWNMYAGVDVVNLFWYSNHGETRLEDTNPAVRDRAAFKTHGLTDGLTSANDWNRKYLPTGWYLGSFRNEIEGYFLKHAVQLGLVQGTVTDVIPTVDPTLYAFAVQKETNESGLLVWYSDMLMDKKTMRILLDPTEISVDVVTFEGADVRQNLQGVTTTVASSVSEGVRYIDIQVGECPVLVKTKNIGIEKLKAVDEIRIQSISPSAIKLTWLDVNVDNNHKTKIFKSLSASSGYTIVHNAVISNGEYVVSGLDENTNYFFRIQLEDGAKQSDMSPTYGASTLTVLPTPTDFETTSQTTSSITLGWDFDVDDEDLIDKFVIYRSNSITGYYEKVGTVNKNLRVFYDTGLLASQTFYYKLYAGKGADILSQPSLTVSATTGLPDGSSPVPIYAKSDYLGNHIYIRVDKPVKNVAGNEAAFTVISSGTTVVPIYETKIDESDDTVIVLVTAPIAKDVDLLVDYTFLIGSVADKDTNVLMNSITNLEATNNVGSTDILTRKVNINFINGGSPYGNVTDSESWNNINLPVEGGNNQYQGDLFDKDNVNTPWRFFTPWSDYPLFINKWDSTYLLAHTYSSIPANITDLFPASSLTSGNMMVNWAPRCGFKVSGLDTSKVYNIWYSAVAMAYEDLPTGSLVVETPNGLYSDTLLVDKTDMKIGLLQNVPPNQGNFTGQQANALEYDGSEFASTATTVVTNTNDIALMFENETPEYRMIITGIVIEELIPLVI